MTPTGEHCFPKKEKIFNRRDIANLMSKGKWGCSGFVRYCCLKPNGSDTNRVMVSVPKKHFKRAVKRNLLKRRMRECYRLNKDILLCGNDQSYADIMFLYNEAVIHTSEEIRETIKSILTEIAGWER